MNIDTHKFKRLLLEKRISQKELEEQLNLPRTRVSVWLNRKSIPNKYIDAINKVLGVDIVSYFDEQNSTKNNSLSSDVAVIPYFGEVDITSNELPFWLDNALLEPTASYVIPDSSADFILPVIGNSMSPNIEGGDKIAIKEVKDISVIFYGCVYVIVTEDYRLVKVIKKHKDESKVILHSYNSAYDDIDLPKSKIIKMFTVQEVLKKML